MLHSLDYIDILWKELTDSIALTSGLSGGIYKLHRPINSNKEDIVINLITADNEFVQVGVCNVNLHIPMLPTQQPNIARMREVAKLVAAVINDGFNKKYTFHTYGQQILYFRDTDEWMMNFKIRINAHHKIIN